MLSQLRLHDDASRGYACAPMRLPSIRMPSVYHFHHESPQQHSYHYATHDYHHYHHHHHPYQRPSQTLPSLSTSVHAGPRSPVSDNTHKCSLAFILAEPTPSSEPTTTLPLLRTHSDTSSASDADSLDNEPIDRPHGLKHKRRSPSTSVGSKSKYCIVEGCTSRAKHARKCWRHGGSVKCKVQDCINRAKSRGVCWSHGGGTTCSHPNCGTIAVSHGFCWAHGGGKRCEIGGCSRPAYERTQNMCSTHFKQQKAAAKATASASATM